MKNSLIQEASIHFKIDQQMVDLFAQLTGDWNSLHTNPQFATRSMYRRNVVHGMLPILFISGLNLSVDEQKNSVLTGITGKFVHPVFEGDSLSLKAEVSEDSDGLDGKYAYTVINLKSKTVLTTGYFTISLSCEISKKILFKDDVGKDISLLLNQTQEAKLLLSEIEEGHNDYLDFCITNDIVSAYYSLIKSGLSQEVKEKFSLKCARIDVEELVTTSLLSTFIGMKIPGRYATFIDFQTRFSQRIRLKEKYKFIGNVEFKTDSAKMLIERFKVQDENGQELFTAKVNVRVQEPPKEMPGIMELKKNHGTLGLENKVALVTGSSRGIGETTAKLLSSYGVKVAVNYCKGKELAQSIVREMIESGNDAIAIGADVSNPMEVKNMIAEVHKKFGRIDILVNNASGDFNAVPFLELDWNDFQKDLDIVIQGAFHCCQGVLPFMVEQGGGKIINVSTVAAENPPPKQVKYVTTKNALIGLTRSLAVEFASQNIQINMVVPSFVETDLTQCVSDIAVKEMIRNTPMKRNATAVDVAKSVVCLASDLTSFTTGQKIMVTGGNAPFL